MRRCLLPIAVAVLLFAACGTEESDVAVGAEGHADTYSGNSEADDVSADSASDAQAGRRVPSEPDVFLDVSNQSFFDPEVQVVIRGETNTYVDASFPVEGQHHVVQFPLTLGVGTHRLTLSSDSGAVEKFTVDVTEDGPTYVFVNYWAEQGFPPYFQVGQSKQPFVRG